MSVLPSVSIIICSYNHEKWVSRCIRSIINQKIIKPSEFEVIFIDDFSTDKTQKILTPFKDIKNVKLYKNSFN